MFFIKIYLLFYYFSIKDCNILVNCQDLNGTSDNLEELNSNSIDLLMSNKMVMSHYSGFEAYIDYMVKENINQAVVFSCGSDYDTIKHYNLLSRSGITSLFLKEDFIDEDILKRVFPERETKCVYVNYDCLKRTELFDMASKLSLFDDLRKWLIFTSDPATTILTLRNVNLNLDTQLIMVLKENTAFYIAYDIYNIDYSKGAPLNITFYGIYTKNLFSYDCKEIKPLIINKHANYTKEDIDILYENLRKSTMNFIQDGGVESITKWQVFLTDSWVKRRWSMRREVTLNAAYCAVDRPKGIVLKKYLYSRDNVHRDTFTRLYIHMMDYIMEMFEFNINLIRTENWGGLVNGSWSGVLGALTKSRADISVSPMTLKKERVGAGDVVGYTSMARFPVMFRQPHASRASLVRFVYPLEKRTWIAALPISIFAVLLGMFIMYAEKKFLGPQSENMDLTLGNFVISLVCVLYQDGPERNPRLASGRTLLFVMLMFGFLLNEFYSASLIGSILMEPSKQITNVKDLINSDLEFRAESVPYQSMFFKEHMHFDYVNELYHKKLTKPGTVDPYVNIEDGLALVKRGGFAFQANAAYAYKEMKEWGDDIICELDEIFVYPLTRLYSRVKRGSPYRQHFTIATLMIYERGIQSHLIDHWYLKKPRCPPEHASTPKPVGEQINPALELLSVIGICSVLLLIVECMMARALKNRRLYTYIC